MLRTIPLVRIVNSWKVRWIPIISAEAILQAGDADLIALARAFLYNPRWGWQAAAELGGQVQATPAYWRCLPRHAQHAFGAVTMGGR